jgi:hypothetical protein
MMNEPTPAGEATIEVLLIGLENPDLSGSLIGELSSLQERNVIRVVDVILVDREADQTINVSSRTQLSPHEAEQFRRLMGDAIGLRPDQRASAPDLRWQGRPVLLGSTDVRAIAETLAPGQAAMAIVFEHRWAHELGRLVHSKGVRLIEDDVLTPELLAGGGGVSLW